MRSFDSFFLFSTLIYGIGGGLVLLVQFLSLRMRNSGLPVDERDPHVGRKFAIGVFLHLSVMLLLVGLTISSVDIFDELINGTSGGWNTPATMRAGPGPGGPWGPPPTPAPKPFFNAQQRLAAGLMLSGVLHGVLFAMILYFGTNSRKFPAVSRTFVLNRLILSGVLLMSITTIFCIYLFAEDSPVQSPFGNILGVAVVWGPTAILHLLWLMVGLRKEKSKARVTRTVEVVRPVAEADEQDDEDRPRRRRRDNDD